MIKLIIFDLDGVLIDAKNIHFKALNEALGPYAISWDEHLSTFDGLKTYQKLQMLTETKELPISLHSSIWLKKQQLTVAALKSIVPNPIICDTLRKLRDANYKIACCSNSIRNSVFIMLDKLDLISYMDLILSNEDVGHGKPHPEIYWKAMSIMGFLPEETLIIEDSPHGLLAATRSQSHVMRVKSPEDINYDNIIRYLEPKSIITPKWKDDKLNILIPMAGAGSRFEKAGYTFPKPLIEVNGKPMIQLVVENLNIEANYIYIVQKSHREKYNLDTLLQLITPQCKVIEVNDITEGAACTTLLAKQFIDNQSPLLYANSDQFVEWNSNEFLYKMNEINVDGGMLIFESTHPKWSFVRVNRQGIAIEVAEKNPISNLATVGIYYWKHGSDYVKYAEQMIKKNIRTNNEFYVCPVFNEAIQDKKQISTFHVKKMWGLGTPEDLENFLKNH